ncbi:MAG: hypothetical protein DDT25_00024 [Chloroflexi bacterium]|nr:hypothetical protein [Chloroflexota bacterium]
MRYRSCVALAAAIAAFPVLSEGQTLIGRASVIDGDTIEIRSERVRLSAIDAPESSQTCSDSGGREYRCGQQAALALSDFIGSQNVRCEVAARDRFKRAIGECYMGQVSVNAWMIRNGWALPYVQFGGRKHLAGAAEARRERRGVWQGEFVAPWDFRSANRGRSSAEGVELSNRRPNDPGVMTCDDLRRAGRAPAQLGSPEYRASMDRDRDGVACE